jgi:hypothetical protein
MSIFVSMSKRLVLYPNGNTNSNGNSHISLYLEIFVPLGWKFLLLNVPVKGRVCQ